jgi:hypothetical protein
MIELVGKITIQAITDKAETKDSIKMKQYFHR